MVALLTHPILVTTVLVGGVSAILYAFWFMYSPLYLEYVDSCVQTTNFQAVDNGNVTGTMLYRNGFELAYSYAASDGDALATQNVDELNVGRDLECNQYTVDDTLLFNAMIDEYNKLSQRVQELQFQNAALDQ